MTWTDLLRGAVAAQVSFPLGWFRASVPWFLPGVIFTLLIGLFVTRPLARALGERPWITYLLVLGFGLVLSATLTPYVGALEDGTASTGMCDVGRIGPASLRMYARFGDESLNVLLFIPLGVALGLMHGRAKRALIGMGLLLPATVELTQLLAPALGRGCETADVFDNMLGLTLGVGAGWLLDRISVTGRHVVGSGTPD